MQTRSSPSTEALYHLADHVGLKHYHQYSKSHLYDILQRQYDFDRLVRAFQRQRNIFDEGEESASNKGKSKSPRKRVAAALEKENMLEPFLHHSPSSSNGSRKKKRSSRRKKEQEATVEPLNSIDPIMLSEIGENKFIFERPNGTLVQYNIESLIQYFLVTGDFVEPETRIEFADKDLKKLDYQAKHAGLFLDSVFEAKTNKATYAAKKEQRDAILAIERCAGEAVSEMMKVIENYEYEDAQMYLAMRVFPSFADLFGQILAVDSSYAHDCLCHYVEFIRGPPNRPTNDPEDILPIVLDFLESVSNEDHILSGFGY